MMTGGDVREFLELQVVTKVGEGGFGEVFIVRSPKTGKEYALKVEQTEAVAPQLEYEMRIYMHLKALPCLPKVEAFWEDTKAKKRCLVFERLGPNLEAVKGYLRGSDRLLWAATRLVHALKQIHNKDIIHRDIKPENILIGLHDDPERIGCDTQFFYVDFGLSKRYKRGDGSHILFVPDKRLSGTARYASINLHRGFEQSRRDDLESLGYVFIYLYLGSLPWMGLRPQSTTAKTAAAIGDMKASMPLDKLCAKCPPQLLEYMKYVRALEFDQTPDYAYLETCLRPRA